MIVIYKKEKKAHTRVRTWVVGIMNQNWENIRLV
jgi:hypothetical protein